MKSSALKSSHFNVIAIRASPHKQPEKICSLQIKSSAVYHHKKMYSSNFILQVECIQGHCSTTCIEESESGFGLTTKSYELISMEVLYNVLTEFGMGMKPLVLIQTCLNETLREVWTGIHLSNIFPVQNDLK